MVGTLRAAPPCFGASLAQGRKVQHASPAAPAVRRHTPRVKFRPALKLLELFTASMVRDAGLDITFDARLAIYIASSNNPHKVPESVRSRLPEFEIRRPTGEHALQIAQVVLRRTVEKLLIPNFAVPEPRLAFKIAHLDPRSRGRSAGQFSPPLPVRSWTNAGTSGSHIFLPDDLDEEGSPPVFH